MAIRKKKQQNIENLSIEMIIARIIDKNRLMQSAMQLHPKALPRASVVGRVAKEMSDYVSQLETLWQQSKII